MHKDEKERMMERPDKPVALGKPKRVRGEKGKVLRQYPPKPGFHGSDKEAELSPEE